ncbi:MAG: hypothetical protein NT166_25915 [Candidatus Aminicenantes bacterium]|nr:hypothetical protein [Candidatus Aminicenantes bacterium]
MTILKKLTVILLAIFYIGLIGFSVVGLCLNGINQIQPNVFYFVLIGLFLFPLLLKFIPALESFNIFGFELKFQKELEETKRHVNDLQTVGDEKMKQYILQFVKEEYLTDEGKRTLQELREDSDAA